MHTATISFAILLFCGLDMCRALKAEDCFKRFGNCDIVNYKPFRREWRVTTERNCTALCAQQSGCEAVVYDVRQFICNMFDQDGSREPAFLIPAFKKVFYKKIRSHCDVGPTATEEAPVVEPTKAECPNGQLPFFIYFAEGKTVTGNDGQEEVKTMVGREDCTKYCEDNMDSDGNDLPCWGFTFTYAEGDDGSGFGSCVFHTNQLKPNGTASLANADRSFAYVKVCMSDERVKQGVCSQRIFEGLKQRTLKGQDFKTIDSLPQGLTGLQRCMELCINESDEDDCRSATFDLVKGECELKFSSSFNRPDRDIIPNDNENLVFFENGCLRENVELFAAVEQEVASERVTTSAANVWSNWSPCQLLSDDDKIKVQARYLLCSEPDTTDPRCLSEKRRFDLRLC